MGALAVRQINNSVNAARKVSFLVLFSLRFGKNTCFKQRCPSCACADVETRKGACLHHITIQTCMRKQRYYKQMKRHNVSGWCR